MAKAPMLADKLLWSIKRSTDTSYMLVACQVDLTFPLSRTANTDITKCGVFKSMSALDAKATINGTAMFNIEEDENAVSYNDLAALIVSNDTFSSKFSDEDGNIYVEGDTQMQQIELTGSAGENVKFAANIEFMDPASLDFTPTT